MLNWSIAGLMGRVRRWHRSSSRLTGVRHEVGGRGADVPSLVATTGGSVHGCGRMLDTVMSPGQRNKVRVMAYSAQRSSNGKMIV